MDNTNESTIRRLDDNENQEVQEYSYGDFLSYSYKIFLSFFVLILIEGLLYFFELDILGSVKPPNSNLIYAVLTVNMVFIIIYYPFIIGQITIIAIQGTNAFANSKNSSFSNIVHRTRFIGYGFLFTISLIMIFITPFLLGFFYGLNDFQGGSAFMITIIRSIAMFFEFEFYIILTIFMITSNGLIAFLFLVITLLFSLLFTFIFISLLGLGEYGGGIARIASYLIGLIIFWIYTTVSNSIDKEIIILSKNAFNSDGVKEHLLLVIRLVPTVVFENIDKCIIVIFSKYYGVPTMLSIMVLFSIYQLYASFSYSFYNSTMIIMSNPIGKGDYPKAKKWSYYLILTAGVFSLILCLILFYPFRRTLLLNSGNDMNLIILILNNYLFYVALFFLETINWVLRNILKSLHFFTTSLVISFIMVLVNIIIIFLMGMLSSSVTILFIGYIVYLILSIVTFSVTLYLINWNDNIRGIRSKIDDRDYVPPPQLDEETAFLKENKN